MSDIACILIYRESSITHRHLFNQVLQNNTFNGKVQSTSVKCYKCKMASHDQFFFPIIMLTLFAEK